MIVQQKKILKSQYIVKFFILFYILLICLPPNFQYKKWTSARVRACGQGSWSGCSLLDPVFLAWILSNLICMSQHKEINA